MKYRKMLCAVFILCCCFLWSCSLSFCGLTVGGRKDLVFTCGEDISPVAEEMLEEQPKRETEAAKTVPEATGERVDLNTAGLEELQTLTGIGQTRARAILEYRNQYGPFAQPEDIMQVPGIKEGIFSKIKDQITVQ